MEKITYITPAPDRWSEVRDLRLEALKSDPFAFSSLYEDNVKYDETKWRSYLEQASPGNRMVFVEHEGKLIASTRIVLTDDLGEIFGVYVKEEYRGKGIASALMREVIAELEKHGAKKIRLEVNPDQICAVKLYAKFGFTKVGEDKFNKYNTEVKTDILEMHFGPPK